MREGTITRWHVGKGDRVQVGDLLYDVRVDRLTAESDRPVDMEVEAHEDVYISALLVREGESASPLTAVALAVDEEDELAASLPDRDEIERMSKRDEHLFMWQGYVRNASEGSGMCDKNGCS
jgi:pyruvate/2-oxoglutarate dehydrogenase complex dihydrolipoamide acyltransferase (E2) component